VTSIASFGTAQPHRTIAVPNTTPYARAAMVRKTPIVVFCFAGLAAALLSADLSAAQSEGAKERKDTKRLLRPTPTPAPQRPATELRRISDKVKIPSVPVQPASAQNPGARLRYKTVQADSAAFEPDALEPNDTPETATLIAFGERTASTLSPAADLDFFRFAAGPEWIQVHLQGQGIAGVTIRLLDADGVLMAESGSWLVAELSRAGEYTVQIESPQGYADYLLSTGAFSASRTVDPTGTADHRTIAAAMAAAAAGDTILVLPGTYEESIALREQITLVGANPRTTTLNGEVRADTSSGASIRGFSLQNAKGSALVINASSVAISHCLIEQTAHAAIQVAGSGAAAEIHSNWIAYNATDSLAVDDQAARCGIYLHSGGSAEISGNSIVEYEGGVI